MAVDRYTKAILTVITVCLVWLSLGGPALIAPVSAQPGPAQTSGYERVILYGWVDQSGAERRFPLISPLDARPEFRGNPRPLPIWQDNK